MAATFNESQKIDYLWKKGGYGVTKTAEPTSKEAFNESIASPLLYRGDLVWMQSGDIPATPPTNTTAIVEVYKDGGGGGYSPTVECTEDLTAPDNQTWKTNQINWIPTQFGDNYLVQVYVANTGVNNPQTVGTKLFAAGSGNDDTWFFDYQSGVLNFNGANIPSQITGGIAGKSIYIVGFKYVGLIGVTNLPSDTDIGNLNFIGETIPAPLTSGKVLYIVGYRYIGLVGVTNLPSDTDIGNLNFTGNTITSTTGNISITSNVDVTGTVVATTFQGNGAALTNTLTSRGSDTNNWDALTQMGAYKVNRLDWSGTTGTPIDSTVYVGLLQVLTSDDTTTQIFFPGTVDANNVKIQWNRSLWSSTWTEWIKIVNDKQTIDAGIY